MHEFTILLMIGSAFVFGWATFLLVALIKKLYGGKFTSVIPYLVAAVFVMFLSSFIELFGVMINGNIISFTTQPLHIIVGILLLAAVYQLYLMNYATAGFRVGRND
ncbi:MAG TPA: hypothetical protein VI912_01735 [Candidatus Bilamarchaeaceae archaeon]|nr:hypothetical protein [Candidatus Bilamarchaeaceae archaeon]